MTRFWACMVMATCLLACNDEVLLDEGQTLAPCRVSIGFDNGYVDHVLTTRAGKSQLSDYVSTMGVWGWQTDEDGMTTPLFSNHLVEYAGDWTYTPLRYWDDGSAYAFYAYAPHASRQKGGATVGIDDATGRLTIAGVTLQGDNLQTVPSATLQQVFSATAAPHDDDWMVARTGQTALGISQHLVSFTMQHVLAKLNVRIHLDDVLAADTYLRKVIVESLQIGELAADGTFVQQHASTPNGTGSETEWTTGSATQTLQGASGLIVQNSWRYMLESLVIPQALPAAAEVVLVYALEFVDDRIEHYTYRLPLTDVFSTISHFVSGNSYTLSFTIAPDVIRFDAGLDVWTEGAAGTQTP